MDTSISGIIPAVGSMKGLMQFLESDYHAGVVMNVHIALLDSIFSKAHEAGKALLIHLDMIHGLASDEYGCEYICQKYHPLAGISIRPSVIACLKKNKVTAIQRVFLIDTLALNKSVESVRKTCPDYVEVLPGMCVPLFGMLKERMSRPMIAGGLIPSEQDAREILQDINISAVTISVDRLSAPFNQRVY